MNTPLTPRALARTYEHPSYSDPWDAVEDYERVQEYAATHPNAGRTAVGTALDLPPSRVRGWLNGGKPDCVRAVDEASSRGWFEANADSETFAALNELVAAVYSGGSIDASRWVPTFTDKRVTDALDELGVTWELVERDAGRADEVVAREPGSVLGRALSVLGAPVGEKRDVHRLPQYLAGASGAVRGQFVAVYLRNRGHSPTDRTHIQVREERPEPYLRALAKLFESVLPVEATVSEKNIHLRRSGVLTESVLTGLDADLRDALAAE